MKSYHIAALPGDGVGSEVTREAFKVLRAAAEVTDGFSLDIQTYDAGVGQYLKCKKAISEKVYEECKAADAIFMGAIGQTEPGPLVLDENGTEVSGHVMFKLRFGLDLFAGVRPIKLYPGVPSALAPHDAIDFIVLRESCEGLFASYGGGIYCRDCVATDTQVITRQGSEKISNFAFELAKGRNGRVSDGKKIVTCAEKGNVFRSFAFLRKIFREVAQNYAGEVDSEAMMIDALALLLVQHPENFDVIMFENMHGDIMSDMAAAFVGGMGMAPSGDIGLEHAMFQPAHGTAPTLAGKNIVNPTAAILSGKMMLEWLGKRYGDENLIRAAGLLEQAVTNTFADGIFTQDLKGNVSTSQFGDEVVARLHKLA
ncbi:isocitrate/isopropylmalate dehydrogenase family protein [Marasmitruncus massiliensis]|uniref:isocitrate/isopropylmalate dehydrogenase family protein n=1 Tax=Marasmitruncus massiliensis TaxID=1944642 RepID=UPI000C79C550|nr:isocitrate/isopropylmalate family dehydrogenase [Marasmitruncus massiliensis]